MSVAAETAALTSSWRQQLDRHYLRVALRLHFVFLNPWHFEVCYQS